MRLEFSGNDIESVSKKGDYSLRGHCFGLGSGSNRTTAHDNRWNAKGT